MFVDIFLSSYGAKIPAMYFKNPNKAAPVVLIPLPKEPDKQEKSILNLVTDVFKACNFSILVIYYNLKNEGEDLNDLIKDNIRPLYEISFASDWIRSHYKTNYLGIVGINSSCQNVLNIVMRRPEFSFVALFNPFNVRNIEYSFFDPTPCSTFVFNDKNTTRASNESDCMKFIDFIKDQSLYKIFFKQYDSSKKNYITELKPIFEEVINEEQATKVHIPIKKKRRKRSKKNKFDDE